MEAAVSGVEVGLDGHEEEGAYDTGAEVEVGQRCADVAGEWSELMEVDLGNFGGLEWSVCDIPKAVVDGEDRKDTVEVEK